MKKIGRKSKPLTEEQQEIIDSIYKEVERITGYDKKTIVKKNRTSNFVMIRMIIASILRNDAHLSLRNTGLALLKHHSSIVYYVKSHKDNLSYPPYNKLYFNIYDKVVHKIKRTDMESIDVDIDKLKSRLDNLKHKRRLLIWATRRYESSEV